MALIIPPASGGKLASWQMLLYRSTSLRCPPMECARCHSSSLLVSRLIHKSRSRFRWRIFLAGFHVRYGEKIPALTQTASVLSSRFASAFSEPGKAETSFGPACLQLGQQTGADW